MVFSSIIFIFTFLPVTIAIYYLTPVKLRNGILLLASLFFYAWGEPIYLFLMLYSILFNYVIGIDIAYKKSGKGWAGGSLLLGIFVNLLLLGFFKYYGFLAVNLGRLLSVEFPKLQLSLPVGLSFYTFQSLSYLADVYRGQAKPQKNIVNFGLYISMFPQLVAGPIVQYTDMEAQLERREMSMEKFGQGVFYFIWGLSKKVLLANHLGAVFETVTALPSLSVLSAWVGALAYTFQIYYDFSGYSDMAVGLGKMFGFELKENFNHPYCSRSITEFWRRWHISLGAWFRDYVYIPLGGNHVGAARHIFNLLIVWALTGLWHGASWNFVIWGLYYGILLIFEKYILRGVTERIPVLGILYTMLAIVIGWVLFFSNTIGEAGEYLRVMFGMSSYALVDKAGIYYLLTNLIVLWLAWMYSTPFPGRVCVRKLEEGGYKEELLLALHFILFLIATSYLIHDTYNPFLYFRF